MTTYRIIGRTEQRPDGYPAFCCNRCPDIWHVGQSARWSDAALMAAKKEAMQQGWRFSEIGGHTCGRCAGLPA